MEVLKDIPFEIDLSSIFQRLRLDPTSEYADDIGKLAAEAGAAARPKAAFSILYVGNRCESSLEIGGERFTSRVLLKNLEYVERVFAYVATCGEELDRLSAPVGDPMLAYCLDIIKERTLRAALAGLKDHLKRRFALENPAGISPGSLPDWPVTEQGKLFRMLGDVHEAIGVRLTDSYLMVPVKSVSGLLYPTEISFESCQLCPRENCRERRARYDPRLVEEYGIETVRTDP